MTAQIITIGDEILIGQIIDTNSAFIAKQLEGVGISISKITSIQDTFKEITNALEDASNYADLVIVTGGLGPTSDDVTKPTICSYFNDHLVEDKQVLNHIKTLFKNHVKKAPLPVNLQQAMVPSKADILFNTHGTAPGLWIFDKEKDTVFVFMPGVPYEMHAMVKTMLLPKIQKHFNPGYILHKTIITYGVGESVLAEKIASWQASLPCTIKLAYLPNLGRVRLRLSTKGKDKQALNNQMQEVLQELYPLLSGIVYTQQNDIPLEQEIASLLCAKKQTLSIAESCTGGAIAQIFTKHSGASTYFVGSFVSYATAMKATMLGISLEFIEKHSVISSAVAEQMALASKKITGSTYAIATTGNAGPSIMDTPQEQGVVFIAIAGPFGVFSQRFSFGKSRQRVIEKATHKALELLHKKMVIEETMLLK